jgi:N-acetylmuramoyl-L-alanine amidase
MNALMAVIRQAGVFSRVRDKPSTYGRLSGFWPLLAAAISMLLAINLAVPGPVAHAAPKLVEVAAARLAGNEVRTRFVADLSTPVSYSVYVIGDPYRVVVDMAGASFSMPPSAGEAGKGLISGFRFGQVAPGKSRIVIDTTGPVLIEKSFVLNAENGQPARMVIDLVQTDERTFARVKANERPAQQQAADAQPAGPAPDAPRIEPTAAAASAPATMADLLARAEADAGLQASGLRRSAVPIPRPNPRREAAIASRAGDAGQPQQQAREPASQRPVIVLDPGHGGIDGGAVSRKGVKEKEIVLSFAHKLRAELLKSGRYDVYMTRDDDTFISLAKRVRFARQRKADLFIAVHADSLRQRSVRGATVYTLSEEASDEDAAALAERENAADFIGGIETAEDIDEEVGGILLDLALRETKNHSIYFARRVVKSLKPVSRLNRRPMRSAGFKVLRAPDVPSVLLELGYLSNRHDEKNLVSARWRQKTAQAVTRAIDAFFSPEVAARQAGASQ